MNETTAEVDKNLRLFLNGNDIHQYHDHDTVVINVSGQESKTFIFLKTMSDPFGGWWVKS